MQPNLLVGGTLLDSTSNVSFRPHIEGPYMGLQTGFNLTVNVYYSESDLGESFKISNREWDKFTG